MAIMASQIQTALNWTRESYDLFRRAPRKWLLLSFTYIFFFLLLPTLPGLQLISLVIVLVWPIFLAFALSLYRNADQNKLATLSKVFETVKPYLITLVSLGLVCFIYGVLVGFLLNNDLEGIIKFSNAKVVNNAAMMQILTIITKAMFFMLPLFMMTWFSPMLIKQNGYTLTHALKSSIAGCLQYFVALSITWLLITVAIIVLMLVLGITSGILGALLPLFGKLLMPMVMLFNIVLATALMLAFQYISYRDVFKAATTLD